MKTKMTRLAKRHPVTSMVMDWHWDPVTGSYIKWVGGKRGLLPELRRLRPKNFRTYHEPFLGGGAHFYDLYESGFRGRSYIYDANLELMRTYSAIKYSWAAVIGGLDIHRGLHSREYFEGVRKIDIAGLDDVGVAARMIYLNRASFNGLFRVNKQGGYNSPFGDWEGNLDEWNIVKASAALHYTTLVPGDFGHLLGNVREGDFVLLDPPYYGTYVGYTAAGFGEVDQKRLHDVCRDLDSRHVRFVLSNSDCPFIRNLYRDFRIIPVKARRNINCKGDGRGPVGEIIAMNYTPSA